ncbi:hypothetical protein [Canibacter zhoujuaniae]|uniref:hypothetical protein n=1 Tax=Canibacter zhoujuaniae TaxID=2708343 RepID=UPI00141E930C|nr:hypothetical protein [Canibacter zhoujuaniae]
MSKKQSSRLELFLGWGSVSLILISVLAFFVTLIFAAFLSPEELNRNGIRQLVWIAYVGLPVGFAMLFTLLFLDSRKRRKKQLAK